MKKLLSGALALVLCAALSGCGSTSGDEKSLVIGASITPHAEIIKNIQNHQAALPGYDDEPEYIPYASGEVETMPLVDPNPVKSTFIPAVWERRKVAKIMKRMREGRYKLRTLCVPPPDV